METNSSSPTLSEWLTSNFVPPPPWKVSARPPATNTPPSKKQRFQPTKLSIVVDAIPNEAWLQILSYLSPPDLYVVQFVNKRLHSLANSKYTWKPRNLKGKLVRFVPKAWSKCSGMKLCRLMYFNNLVFVPGLLRNLCRAETNFMARPSISPLEFTKTFSPFGISYTSPYFMLTRLLNTVFARCFQVEPCRLHYNLFATGLLNTWTGGNYAWVGFEYGGIAHLIISRGPGNLMKILFTDFYSFSLEAMRIDMPRCEFNAWIDENHTTIDEYLLPESVKLFLMHNDPLSYLNRWRGF